MLVIAAPGQGAQTPGFLAEWLQIQSFADRMVWLSAVSGLDLVGHGTEADAETIRDTAIAQPLLVAAAIAVAHELLGAAEPACGRADLVAGHSVGEIAAAALTGALSVESAMVFVRERGQGMAAASAVQPTGMSAVVAGKPDEVLAAIEAAGLVPANNNGSGQIVAAGTLEQLQQLADNPPARARVVPLQVAGAFHTSHMAPAMERLEVLARSMPTGTPATRLLSNRDGEQVADGREYLSRMVSQVTNPVRWDLCMDTMASLGVTGLLELAPAGTLTGIAKRNLKGVDLFNLNTPDQLDEARDFCARHADKK
ncbi:MAG: ACP S-malonyltransferase [Brooklawnia sp.]|uniref:ACP S-malonyltransferase n=1 Tax=Brooklawnia sp. TaxID=2699740 RepID=UPI003C71A51C